MNAATGRRVAALLGAAAMSLLAACGDSSSSAASEGAAVVTPIEGTELSRVTLTQRAAQRLDVTTKAVATGENGSVVPYAAVLYSSDGATWVYTSPEPLNFVRAPITIRAINGTTAVLSKGPPVGTQVATVGVAELFGAESGLGQ